MSSVMFGSFISASCSTCPVESAAIIALMFSLPDSSAMPNRIGAEPVAETFE